MTTHPEAPSLIPVDQTERINSLDVLRGFALLGILAMNIQAFSMVGAAYMNPTVYGDLTGANYWVWYVSHLLFDQKFMALFSTLFGAGIVLMWRRAEAKTRRATGLHYRRTFWLMVFGLVHAYGVWAGDILFVYSLCALWVFWLKRRSPKALIIIGAIVLMVSPILMMTAGLSVPWWLQEDVEQMMVGWQPTLEQIAEEVANYQGGWSDQGRSRVKAAVGTHTVGFIYWAFWRVSGLMIVGMALFKIGFFSAELSNRIYKRCIGISFLGLPILVYSVHQNFASGWNMERFFFSQVYNYFASLLVSLGYASVIMLICKYGLLTKVTSALANVGRMALTNYLLHTIIATTIFYGHGLGYFGQVSRVGQILIVCGIWAFQIPFSAWWLKRFRFGPFEWLWRTLSYMDQQPLMR
ncbi:MAG: DUF418 domain-containing protein [Acidobacteriota bacterium]|jgi:uncharacterized protein|nr:DUF418 domain-containing protein [Acidobacteriota bacterium]